MNIAESLSLLGYTPRSYSGRWNYGKPCLAVVISSPKVLISELLIASAEAIDPSDEGESFQKHCDFIKTIMKYEQDTLDNQVVEQLLEIYLEHYDQDTLADQTIVYWPDLPPPDQY